jgi:hypothetical protein
VVWCAPVKRTKPPSGRGTGPQRPQPFPSMRVACIRNPSFPIWTVLRCPHQNERPSPGAPPVVRARCRSTTGNGPVLPSAAACRHCHPYRHGALYVMLARSWEERADAGEHYRARCGACRGGVQAALAMMFSDKWHGQLSEQTAREIQGAGRQAQVPTQSQRADCAPGPRALCC